MKRPHPISKLTSKQNPKKKFNPSKNTSFGPNLKQSKPLQVKCGHIKKLIHYDCSKKQDDSDDDIPDENEVYVKENLLQNNTEENENNSPDDDFSIVNINMSRLLSLSNSNSKNTSYNANISKENKDNKENKNPKESNKKNILNNLNNFSNGSFNKSKGGEISSGNGSIESNNPNNITNNNSNSNNTNSNSNNTSNNISNNNINYNNGHLSKNSITAKRKKFYDKLMKKDKKVIKPNNNIINEKKSKSNKLFEIDQFDLMKNIPNNNSASSNIKIDNNNNFIFNVKSGTKSLDIRALNNNTNNDMIMRDLRQLHIITQKALCSISTINPLLDTFDNYTEMNRQKNYSNNKILNNKKPIKELLINDNTDCGINQLFINNLTIDKKYNYINNPNININFNNNKPTSSQIINIININGGNYSMDQTKKNILKNIQKSELAPIEESTYDTQFISKPPYISRKGVKNKQYEYDTNTYNNFKQYKTKINKINKLPNKKLSHNNWHGNTINAVSMKNECDNNNRIKKNIEHFKKINKGTPSNISFKNKKNIFIDNNKV